jgi:AAA15 family ATPase/GTPase
MTEETPKPHIQNFKSENDPGLSPNFEWNDIGWFSVITGKNGSGKTKLLNSIYKKYQSTLTLRNIDTRYEPPTSIKNFSEIQSKKGQYELIQQDNNRQIFESNTGKEISGWGADIVNSNAVKTLDFQILDFLFKEKSKKDNDHKGQAEIRGTFDAFPKRWFKSTDWKKFLQTDDSPFAEIDKMFVEFDLPVRIDRFNSLGELKFVLDTQYDNQLAVKASDISTGQQLAFALSLWSWGSKEGRRTQVLLIDEFDAHLNPSLMQKFIEVIKTNFADNGVQVIMTTHDPCAISYAKKHNADIIWMEEGSIVDKNEEDIIHDLSEGVLSLIHDEMTELLTLAPSKNIVFTEGKTDVQHLEEALKVLKYEAKFKEVRFFSCSGVLNIPFFATIPSGKSKSVYLLDNDEGLKKKIGEKTVEECLKDLEEKEQNKSKIIYVSDEADSQIEDLFPKETFDMYPETKKIFENKQRFGGIRKQCFANRITALNKKNPDPNRYEKFKELLDKIIKFFNLQP